MQTHKGKLLGKWSRSRRSSSPMGGGIGARPDVHQLRRNDARSCVNVNAARTHSRGNNTNLRSSFAPSMSLIKRQNAKSNCVCLSSNIQKNYKCLGPGKLLVVLADDVLQLPDGQVHLLIVHLMVEHKSRKCPIPGTSLHHDSGSVFVLHSGFHFTSINDAQPGGELTGRQFGLGYLYQKDIALDRRHVYGNVGTFQFIYS